MSTEADGCPVNCIHGWARFEMVHSSSINESTIEPLLVDGLV